MLAGRTDTWWKDDYVSDTKLLNCSLKTISGQCLKENILLEFCYRTALPLLPDVPRTLGKRPVPRLLQAL